MPVTKKSIRRGEHKIEFYASLQEIRDLYYNKGYVVYTLLYEHLKEKYNWKMSYITFHKYAKRELVLDNSLNKKSKQSSSDETQKEEEIEIQAKNSKNDDPPIAKANFKSGKRFNPHTVDIEPDRII